MIYDIKCAYKLTGCPGAILGQYEGNIYPSDAKLGMVCDHCHALAPKDAVQIWRGFDGKYYWKNANGEVKTI